MEGIPITNDVTYFAHGEYFRFPKLSFGLLSNKNFLRKKLVWLITWPVFEYFMIAIIILNSLLLGFYDFINDSDD
jgi:hypothetical protein